MLYIDEKTLYIFTVTNDCDGWAKCIEEVVAFKVISVKWL